MPIFRIDDRYSFDETTGHTLVRGCILPTSEENYLVYPIQLAINRLRSSMTDPDEFEKAKAQVRHEFAQSKGPDIFRTVVCRGCSRFTNENEINNYGECPDCASTMHPSPEKPLAKQVGGGHYKSLAIQPVEYCHRNKLGFCEASAVKYVTRWREKGGIEDIKKAIHFLEMLIEMETENEQAGS